MTVQYSALVVDDSADNRMIFSVALKQAGYRVVEAGDGFTCLEILKQGLPFHLMVLDMRMPVMNGLEVLRELRKLPKSDAMHIIVCTGNPDMLGGEDVENRADFIVTKPVDPLEFMKFAARLQETPRQPEPPPAA